LTITTRRVTLITKHRYARTQPQAKVWGFSTSGVGVHIADPYVGWTTGQAADQLKVSVHTAKKWASRGWLDPQGNHHRLTQVGTDERGNRLFRSADWLVAEKHTRRSPQSRRQPIAACHGSSGLGPYPTGGR